MRLRRIQLQPQDEAEVAAGAEACSTHIEVSQGPLLSGPSVSFARWRSPASARRRSADSNLRRNLARSPRALSGALPAASARDERLGHAFDDPRRSQMLWQLAAIPASASSGMTTSRVSPTRPASYSTPWSANSRSNYPAGESVTDGRGFLLRGTPDLQILSRSCLPAAYPEAGKASGGAVSTRKYGADDRIRTGDLLITNPIQPRCASLRPLAITDAALLYQVEISG